MPYAVDADLLLRVPDAAAIDPDLRAAALEDAALLIDDQVFDTKTKVAHVWLAAHFLAGLPGSTLGGGGGQVSSMSAGEISVSYAVPQATSDYASTSWGRQFLMIYNSVTHGPEGA